MPAVFRMSLGSGDMKGAVGISVFLEPHEGDIKQALYYRVIHANGTSVVPGMW